MLGIRKIMILWTCISFLFLQFPCNSIAEYSSQAKSEKTVKKPQALTSPEEDFPVAEAVTPQKKGGGKWIWALLGVALIGGVAAAASGGGSSGGGEEDTGSIVISGPAP
jgi:hypothetical protein